MITPTVLRSLDECLLVGPLDVFYRHSADPTLVKIRYLVCLLYPGYVLFCKAKKGPVYQPLHFGALKGLQIVDGAHANAERQSTL